MDDPGLKELAVGAISKVKARPVKQKASQQREVAPVAKGLIVVKNFRGEQLINVTRAYLTRGRGQQKIGVG